MCEYKEMYYKLVNKITDVMGELEQVQKQTEDIFIENEKFVCTDEQCSLE